MAITVQQVNKLLRDSIELIIKQQDEIRSLKSGFVSVDESAITQLKALILGGEPVKQGLLQLFPSNNIFNVPVNGLPVHVLTDQWTANIGKGTPLHPDFGSGTWEGKRMGMPLNFGAGEDRRAFTFEYADESDHDFYPVGSIKHGVAQIEDGSDRHLLYVDTVNNRLYELYNVDIDNLTAGSGAVFNLASNKMRQMGWTSADAAGLPIAPGLVRYEEVAAGVIDHAIRFTAEKTNGSIWPASHKTDGVLGQIQQPDPTQPGRPPLGARFRLKADFDISGFNHTAKVILQAIKTYGIILADNGGNWFFSGCPDERWDNDALDQIKTVKGSAFEAVDCSSLMVAEGSYEAKLHG